MADAFIAGLLSVAAVSAISLISIVLFSFSDRTLKRLLFFLVSFSAGALLGDALIHLLPEAVEASGFTVSVSIYVIAGILVSFTLEKFIHWRHCHIPTSENHPHPFAYVNLFGDAVHNFIDGAIIAASYLVSIPVGVATTLAVIFHEIPQEIGDFGILLHGNLSRWKAIAFNFMTALTAVAGFALAYWLAAGIQNALEFLVPFAAGSFIYVAAADLIPEIHKETRPSLSIIQSAAIVMGIAFMTVLLLFG